MAFGICLPRGNFHQGSWYFFISPVSWGGWINLEFRKWVVFLQALPLLLSPPAWREPSCSRMSSLWAFCDPVTVDGGGNSTLLFPWVQDCAEGDVGCNIHLFTWCALDQSSSSLADWNFQDISKPVLDMEAWHPHPTPTLPKCALNSSMQHLPSTPPKSPSGILLNACWVHPFLSTPVDNW